MVSKKLVNIRTISVQRASIGLVFFAILKNSVMTTNTTVTANTTTHDYAHVSLLDHV